MDKINTELMDLYEIIYYYQQGAIDLNALEAWALPRLQEHLDKMALMDLICCGSCEISERILTEDEFKQQLRTNHAYTRLKRMAGSSTLRIDWNLTGTKSQSL